MASIIVPMLFSTFDFSYFMRFISAFTYFIGYFSILVYIKKNHNSSSDFLFNLIINITCLYILGTVMLYLIPSLKEFWFSKIFIGNIQEGLYENHIAYSFRIGWSGFSGFGMTFMCSLSIVLSLYLFNKNRLTTFLFKIILLLIGNAFYGRVGLLISLLVLITYVIWNLFIKGRFIDLILLSVLSLVAFLLILNLRTKSFVIDQWYEWAMSPLKSLFLYGTVNQDVMFNMYFFPEIRTFLFGDGRYTGLNGGYYMNVDVGYMRPILFYGIFNTIIFYFLIIKKIFKLSLKDFKEISILLIMIVFLFEIKGEIIFMILPLLFIFRIYINSERGIRI
ncbi:hypothetical protein ACQV2S_00240 [Facklamia sp. P13064]